MAYSQNQSPRATIIACSDSRVQMSKINKKSENDIFSIRVIGNQVSTAAGSIEYGIQYLKTPVAMVLGHSDCGAIRAAKTDYDHLSENVKRELDTIQLKSNVSLEKSLIENVNQQVKYLLEKYQDKVESGELVVLGAIYDFSNDFGYGYGSLVFINLNGETDQEKMNKSAYFKDTLALAHIGHQIKNGN